GAREGAVFKRNEGQLLRAQFAQPDVLDKAGDDDRCGRALHRLRHALAVPAAATVGAWLGGAAAADRLAVAVGAEAGVIVDDGNLLARAQVVIGDELLHRPARPGRLGAAIMDTGRIHVLAG